MLENPGFVHSLFEFLCDDVIALFVEVMRNEIGKPELLADGRCMIHLNHIPAETPPEHIHAAVAACHTDGQLPIPENLDDIQFELPKRKSFFEFIQEKGESIDT
ncbi:MAG: hypothetical protein MUO68_22360 [Desulfobacteraceae bacterium]|nr:hypothetical protein [Desulfobacteraceae bacterium]